MCIISVIFVKKRNFFSGVSSFVSTPAQCVKEKSFFRTFPFKGWGEKSVNFKSNLRKQSMIQALVNFNVCYILSCVIQYSYIGEKMCMKNLASVAGL